MTAHRKHRNPRDLLPRAQDGVHLGPDLLPPQPGPLAPPATIVQPPPTPTPPASTQPTRWEYAVRLDDAGREFVGPVVLSPIPGLAPLGVFQKNDGSLWKIVTREQANTLRQTLGGEEDLTGDRTDAEIINAWLAAGGLGGGGGGGGLSFDQQVALEELRQSGALEQIRLGGELDQATQLLLENLRQTGAMDRLRIEVELQARQMAQEAQSQDLDRLQQSLTEIGFSVPGLFVGAQDPAQIRQTLLSAVESGSVVPTLARQELIAEAAQSPKDIIRLLFLSGGQRPPAQRGGEFSSEMLFQQGREALSGLAQQIRQAPEVTFEDLFQRFMVDVPQASPQAAAAGAIIEMRKNKDGLFRAEKGTVTHAKGFTLFSVGEDGEEFALLAPGSVIAPKRSKGEALTQENAARAVTEMLRFGRRLTGKEAAKQTKPKAAQTGSIVTEAELPEQTLESILETAQGVGAALSAPSRGLGARMRDLRLLLKPSQLGTPGERLSFFSRLHPNLQKILLPRGFQQQQGAGKFQQALDLQRAGILESGIFDEGGGVPGTRLPVADILALNPAAQEAAISSLGSLFGSDIVADIFALFSEQRRRAFESSAAILPITR